MATFADPNGNGTATAWANTWTNVDDAVRQPTVPGADAITSGTDEQSETLLFTDPTYVSGATYTLWVYGSSGAKRALDIAYSVNGTDPGTGHASRAELFGANTAAGWHSRVLTIANQTELNNLRVQFICNSTAGGGGAGSVSVTGVYVEIDLPVTNHEITVNDSVSVKDSRNLYIPQRDVRMEGSIGFVGALRDAIIAQSSAQAHSGTQSIEVATTGSQTFQGVAFDPSDTPLNLVVSGGVPITISAWVYWTVARNFTLNAQQLTSTGAFIGNAGGVVAHGGTGWERLSFTFTGNVNLGQINTTWIDIGNSTDVITFYVDDIQLEYGSSASTFQFAEEILVEHTPGGGGTDHEINPSDSVSLADALAFTREILVADSTSLADALALERAIAVADSVSLADALALQRAINVADSVSLTDALALRRDIVVADTVGLADAATPTKGLNVTPADTVSLTDAVRFDRALVVGDVLSLADNIVTERNIARTVADSVTMSDFAVVGRELSVTVDDAVSLADNLSQETGKGVTINDTLAIADAIVQERQLTIADILSLSDALRFDIEKLIADSVTLSDDVTVETGATSTPHEVFPADSVGVADAISTAIGRAVTVEDAVLLADAIALAYGITIEDALSLRDRVEIQLNGVVVYPEPSVGGTVRKWRLSAPGWY